jgi:hypothetical protein
VIDALVRRGDSSGRVVKPVGQGPPVRTRTLLISRVEPSRRAHLEAAVVGHDHSEDADPSERESPASMSRVGRSPRVRARPRVPPYRPVLWLQHRGAATASIGHCRRRSGGQAADRPRAATAYFGNGFGHQTLPNPPKMGRIRWNPEDASPPLTCGFETHRQQQNPRYVSHNPEVAGSNPVPATE